MSVSAARGAAVVLLAGALAAGCGDPAGPPGRGAGPGPSTASPREGASVEVGAGASGEATVDAAASAPPRAPRPYEELKAAPLDQVVMTLRADPDAAARRHAADVYVQRLAEGASPEPLLEACATDLDPLVRRWAALGLAAAPSPALAPRLAALAATEPDPTVRSILARAAREARRGGGRP